MFEFQPPLPPKMCKRQNESVCEVHKMAAGRMPVQRNVSTLKTKVKAVNVIRKRNVTDINWLTLESSKDL